MAEEKISSSSTSSSVDGSPSRSPEQKELEGDSISSSRSQEIDNERSPSPDSPGQEEDEEEDEIVELPLLSQGEEETEEDDDDHDDDDLFLDQEETEKDKLSLSLYESVKEEGYVIPPTSTIIEENKTMGQVYICSEEGCNGRFSKRSYLEQHMCIHTSKRPFVCPHEGCDKTYKRKDHLNRHVKYCSLSPGGGLPPVVCTVEGCDRTFICNTNLRKHVQVYHENKKKKIQSLFAAYSDVVKSDKLLSISPNLDKEELEREEKEKTRPDFDLTSKTPFGCPHPGCRMSFRWMNRLRRHMKVHEGYTCPECGEKFEKWTQLVKHKTAAHKEPQRCPMCDRTFAQGQWLKRHMKVHSDVREMYLCPFEDCSRCYSEKRNLDAHIRSYHDKQRFYCVFEDCGRSFAFKHKMLEHLKIHCNITDPL